MNVRRILFARDGQATLLRVLALTALSVLAGHLLTSLPTVELLEFEVEDLRYRWRGERPIDERILVVEIDDTTREAYEEFPLERDKYALLSFYGPRFGAVGVIYDLFFSDGDSNSYGDSRFALTIDYAPQNTTVAIHPTESAYRDRPVAETPPLPGSVALSPEDARLPALTASHFDGPAPLFANAHHAMATAIESENGSVRRIPLFVRIGDRFVPTLAVAAWMKLQGVAPEDVHLDATTRTLVAADGRRLLALPENLVAEIPFSGSIESFASRRVGMARALSVLRQAGADDATAEDRLRARELFEGRVVIVGLTARSSYMVDFGVMPFDTSAPLLYAHVNLLDGLLRDAPLEHFPGWAGLVVTAIFAAIGIVLAGRMRPLALVGIFVVLVVALVAVGQAVFVQTERMVATIPYLTTVVIAYVGAGVLAFAGQERERLVLRRTFERYVSSDLLENIVARAGEIDLGGDTRNVTVLFLDIREFSTWSRTLSAGELVEQLNDLLSEMVDVVFAHAGSVNKFLGDAILAVFGAPVAGEDDADRAVRAAIEMRRRLYEHNVRRTALGRAPLRIGIGIATGEVVAGNVGSRRRLEYTVIGDPVNRAARLQASSADDQILLDTATVDALRQQPSGIRSIGSRPLKGLGDVEVHEVRPARV